MRALRIATFLFAVLALIAGTSAVAIAQTEDMDYSVGDVTGLVEVSSVPGGDFDVADRVFQYREFPVAGSTRRMSDLRLSGDLRADWNWDVQASGDQPIPAWGSMTIEGPDGSWTGQFTGIQRDDLQPMGVRALLFGDGAFEGLCATLDISASQLGRGDTWLVDGVIHPVDMAS